MNKVYWIGGGSGAGKSTVARRLAEAHDLRLYSTDEAMSDHARRCPAQAIPRLREFSAMTMDQRWLDRSPEVMLETFHWFCGEGFECIVEDLSRLTRERGVIVEGFRLLPELVKPLPGPRVWLLPTQEFRRAAFERRGSLWQIAGKTSDPERALENLLERDHLFTARLRESAARLNLPVLEVGTELDEDTLAARVAESLWLGPG